MRLLILLLFLQYGLAQSLLRIDVARFYTAELSPYIEIYYAVNPLFLKNKNSEVLVETYLYRKTATDSSLVFVEKINLKGKEKDKLWLHLKRLSLQKGNYLLQVKAHAPEDDKVYSALREFSIFSAEPPVFSDIIWVDKYYPAQEKSVFSRSGIAYLPLVNEGVFIDKEYIAFLLEIYALKKVTSSPVKLELKILDGKSKQYLGGFVKRYKSFSPTDYLLVKNKFNIAALPTGNYILEVAILSRDNRKISEYHYPFHLFKSTDYKSSPVYASLYDKYFGYPEEELDDYIKALIYIATPDEMRIAKSLKTYDEKKSFFYAFWDARKESPEDPPNAKWRDYLARYEYANKHFKAVGKKGWQTDRGRVLLKYGLPSDVQQFLTEMDKHPYIIWTYNYLGSQSNVFFVFYDPDLSTNEFPLLHSTLSGEPYNANWRLQLLKGKIPNYNYDSEITSPTLFKDDKTIPASTGTTR